MVKVKSRRTSVADCEHKQTIDVDMTSTGVNKVVTACSSCGTTVDSRPKIVVEGCKHEGASVEDRFCRRCGHDMRPPKPSERLKPVELPKPPAPAKVPAGVDPFEAYLRDSMARRVVAPCTVCSEGVRDGELAPDQPQEEPAHARCVPQACTKQGGRWPACDHLYANRCGNSRWRSHGRSEGPCACPCHHAA